MIPHIAFILLQRDFCGGFDRSMYATARRYARCIFIITYMCSQIKRKISFFCLG